MDKAGGRWFTFDPATQAKYHDDFTQIWPCMVLQNPWNEQPGPTSSPTSSSEENWYGEDSVADPTYYYDAEQESRWEFEEFRWLQFAPAKQFDREDQTRLWLFEEMLWNDVKRAARGDSRAFRLPVEREKARKCRVEREGTGSARAGFEKRKGTPGHEGHRSLQKYFGDMVKKRNTVGEETDGKTDGKGGLDQEAAQSVQLEF